MRSDAVPTALSVSSVSTASTRVPRKASKITPFPKSSENTTGSVLVSARGRVVVSRPQDGPRRRARATAGMARVT